MRSPAACVLALVLAGACGRPDEPITEERFCQEYARRECERVASHCATTPGACEQARAQACRAFAERSKTGGRQYNPANVDRCLEKVSEVYRTMPIGPEALRSLEEVCARVFEGIARANEQCGVDYDCEKDLICDKGRCGTRRTVASGGGCANIGETCPRGEYCTNATGLFMCVKRQDKGQVCTELQPCREAYRCAGVCMDRLPVGMTCERNDDCESGLCNPYGTRRCIPGLTFGLDAPICAAYGGLPAGPAPADAGAPAGDAGP